MSQNLWSTNDKLSRRIKMIDSSFMKIFSRNDVLDNFFHKVLSNLFEGNIFRMLDRYDYRVNPERNTGSLLHPILTGHLKHTSTSAFTLPARVPSSSCHHK